MTSADYVLVVLLLILVVAALIVVADESRVRRQKLTHEEAIEVRRREAREQAMRSVNAEIEAARRAHRHH